MADFSSFTSKFRANRIDAPVSKVVKRPRLSCSQCQKSKIRCDRAEPCNSCVKRQIAATCSYRQPPVSHNADTAGDKLARLESMVKELMKNQTSPALGISTPGSTIIVPTEPQGLPGVLTESRSESGTPVGSGYVGSTHWSSILDDIHELKTVLGSSLRATEATDLFEIEPGRSSNEVIFGSPTTFSLQLIISRYLPPKVEVDRFLALFFQGETFIIPFIHTFYFQRQYRAFWEDKESVSPLWLSTLFSICNLASFVGGALESSPTAQDTLIRRRFELHTAAAHCLVLGDYHRPSALGVEALALYAHCKHLRSLDPSREAGAILGMVIRMAYELGYHRDPDVFGTFTVFEGEMRRRFWASCKQMDMMISFQLGIPSNIRLDDCDTKSPRNLLDSDFDVDTEVLPDSRPEDEATRLLWFIFKEKQMTSFSKICQTALSFKAITDSEILELDFEVRATIDTIPDVLRTKELSESLADSPFLIMTRLYIDFIHSKSLCVLHRKYMARGNHYSTTVCVEAGTRLVGQFLNMYDEFSTGGQLFMVRWMMNNFTVNDFLLGVMVLCLAVHTNRKLTLPNPLIDTRAEKQVVELLERAQTVCSGDAMKCRDARRVSHAIRLTLNGPSSLVDTRLPNPSRSQSFKNQTMSETMHQDIQAFPLSAPWYGYGDGDETAFGVLDPFNFVGNDLNMDWTEFEL